MLDDPKRDALEYALRNWGARQRENDETRDELVLAAVTHGISKRRVYTLTGIARTTIDAIIRRAGQQ